MHIALVHDALIPPPKYGGTERVIDLLAQALIELGHSVTLIAKPGSFVKGARFIAHPRLGLGPGLGPGLEREQTPSTRSTPSDRAYAWIPSDIDLIHFWSTPRHAPDRPYIVNIGGNGRPGEVFLPNTVFVSAKHAKNHGTAHFVHNGINPNDFACDEPKEHFAVFLAKASWSVKNLKGAIQVARLANIPLEVLGSRDWPLSIQKKLPTLRGVHYQGMVGDIEKRAILKKAKALIFPVRWHEPFGLAITEALASGCAVFGTPYGSLPEIVTPKVGYLSNCAHELANAIKEFPYDAKACQARVHEGFTHLQMAKKYLHYYDTIISTGTLGGHAQTQAMNVIATHALSDLSSNFSSNSNPPAKLNHQKKIEQLTDPTTELVSNLHTKIKVESNAPFESILASAVESTSGLILNPHFDQSFDQNPSQNLTHNQRLDVTRDQSPEYFSDEATKNDLMTHPSVSRDLDLSQLLDWNP